MAYSTLTSLTYDEHYLTFSSKHPQHSIDKRNEKAFLKSYATIRLISRYYLLIYYSYHVKIYLFHIMFQTHYYNYGCVPVSKPLKNHGYFRFLIHKLLWPYQFFFIFGPFGPAHLTHKHHNSLISTTQSIDTIQRIKIYVMDFLMQIQLVHRRNVKRTYFNLETFFSKVKEVYSIYHTTLVPNY